MPDFKKNWPELLYKILIAVITAILGFNQYQHSVEHQAIHDSISAIHEYLTADDDED